MDVARHVGGPHHREDAAVAPEPVARRGEPRPGREQRAVPHPERGPGRRRADGGAGQFHRYAVEPGSQRPVDPDSEFTRPEGRDSGELQPSPPDHRPRAVGHHHRGGRSHPVRRPRPAQRDAQPGRFARLHARRHRPSGQIHRTIERPADHRPDQRSRQRRVAGRQHPAAAGAGAVEAVDLQQRAGRRHAVGARDVHQGPQHRLADARGAVLARRVGPRGEPHRQGERPRRERECRSIPIAAGGGSDSQGAGCAPEVDRLGGPDEQRVGEGRLADARHPAAVRRAVHRLVERRAAQHHQAAAGVEKCADGVPGLQREGAAVRQQKHGVAARVQSRRQFRRIGEGVGRQSGQRLGQHRRRHCRDVRCGKPGGLEQGDPAVRRRGLGRRRGRESEHERRGQRRRHPAIQSACLSVHGSPPREVAPGGTGRRPDPPTGAVASREHARLFYAIRPPLARPDPGWPSPTRISPEPARGSERMSNFIPWIRSTRCPDA